MNQEGGDMREFNHSRRNQYEKNSKERTRKKLRMATHTKQSNFKVGQKVCKTPPRTFSVRNNANI